MVIDSYRAIVTDPTNPRVYLLHADAWLDMGKEYNYAKEAIATGQRVCKEGKEELAERYEQIEKLQKEHEEEKYVKCAGKTSIVQPTFPNFAFTGYQCHHTV